MTAETTGLFEGYVQELSRSGTSAGDFLLDHVADQASDPARVALKGLASEDMAAVSRQIGQLVDAEGVSFGQSEPYAPTWHLDPMPLLISPSDWSLLDAGVRQRAELLDLVLTDLYGPRTLLHDRVLPAEIVMGHEGFLFPLDHVRLPNRRQLVLGATDLVRASGGQWTVVSDHTQVPSGAGYAMADRRIISRVLDRLYRSTGPYRLRGFFDHIEQALQEAAPRTEAPRVVLLTAGVGAKSSYDQALTATLLGHPLAQADDLVVEGGRLWMRTIGQRQPVDVVLRNVQALSSDPLDLRPESRLGAPGIVAACRAGRLSVVNHLGAGVLENPALACFLPAVCHRLLGEDLLLPQPATWWCGDPSSLGYVREHLDELVIRPICRTTASPLLGWTLGPSARRLILDRIAAEPWAWVGQHFVEAATAPALGAHGLVPRAVVLRTFHVSAGDDIHLMHGGTARLTRRGDRPLMSHPEGSAIKDVWVLRSSQAGGGTQSLPIVTLRPERDELDRELPPITPRTASNLYWLGRYSERTEATARLLMVVDNLVNDHLYRPRTPGHTAMTTMVDALAAVTTVQAGQRTEWPQEPPENVERTASLPQLRRTMLDVQTPGSVAFDVVRTRETSDQGRALLTGDTSAVVARLAATMESAAAEPEHILLQPVCAQVLTSCLALTGIIAESTVRDEIWAFLEIGRRFERASATLRLVSCTLALARPPITESLVTETVLRACDSLVTYRRRMAAGVGSSAPAAAATELLVCDLSNPRSIAHQFKAVEIALAAVPDTEVETRLRPLQSALETADIATLCLTDRPGLLELLTGIERELHQIANAFESSHFALQSGIRAFSVYESARTWPDTEMWA